MKIVIIDYHGGNTGSVANALSMINDWNYQIKISNEPKDLAEATHIILPGVGSFSDCMKSLHRCDNLIDSLKNEILIGMKPFLGICVGMQVLADIGLEHGRHDGLGFVSGEVRKMNLSQGLKLPHIGWNNIFTIKNHAILKNLPINSDFYFVHSYIFCPTESNETLVATSHYGDEFAAIIQRGDNIIGTQFHPEKSGSNGLVFLKNFLLQ